MAILNSTFTLTSTNLSSNGDTLSISATDILNVSPPNIGVSQVSVANDADTEILGTSGTTNRYVYIYNTDNENLLYLKTDAGVLFARVYPEETLFFCSPYGVGLKIQSDTAAVIVEYATFTKTSG